MHRGGVPLERLKGINSSNCSILPLGRCQIRQTASGHIMTKWFPKDFKDESSFRGHSPPQKNMLVLFFWFSFQTTQQWNRSRRSQRSALISSGVLKTCCGSQPPRCDRFLRMTFCVTQNHMDGTRLPEFRFGVGTFCY